MQEQINMITTLAPCGMNCELCHSFQNKKKNCPGCRRRSTNCVITRCDKRKLYCFECSQYPCRRLRQLDERYRTHYNMSMIENLEFIKEYGENAFLQQQQEKFQCPVVESYKRYITRVAYIASNRRGRNFTLFTPRYNYFE